MWPGVVEPAWPTMAAAVGEPRRPIATLTWLPFGTSPDQHSPRRPSNQSRSCGMRGSQVEHGAQRGSGREQLERLLDLVERQAVRDEPVEREAPAPVLIEDHAEVA